MYVYISCDQSSLSHVNCDKKGPILPQPIFQHSSSCYQEWAAHKRTLRGTAVRCKAQSAKAAGAITSPAVKRAVATLHSAPVMPCAPCCSPSRLLPPTCSQRCGDGNKHPQASIVGVAAHHTCCLSLQLKLVGFDTPLSCAS